MRGGARRDGRNRFGTKGITELKRWGKDREHVTNVGNLDIGLESALTRAKGIPEKVKEKGKNNGDIRRDIRRVLENSHGEAKDLGRMVEKGLEKTERDKARDTRDLVGHVAKLAISQMSVRG
jgi:hypothetical protein